MNRPGHFIPPLRKPFCIKSIAPAFAQPALSLVWAHGSVNHPAGVSLRTSGSQRLPYTQAQSTPLSPSGLREPEASAPSDTIARLVSLRDSASRPPPLRSGLRSSRTARETGASLMPKCKCPACFPSHARKPSAAALRFSPAPPRLAALSSEPACRRAERGGICLLR